MDITAPTDEEFAALRARCAHRHPEAGGITVIGDHGISIRLPVVLGNPSGSSKAPARTDSPSWEQFIAGLLKLEEAPKDLADSGARDCILWPSPVVWEEWCTRWPALADIAWQAARRKAGFDASGLEEVTFDEKLPVPVHEAAEANPRAALRRFNVKRAKTSRTILAVIDAPSGPSWRFFLEAMRAPRAERWKLTREMAEGAIRFAYDEQTKQPVEADALFDPLPGLAVLTALTLSGLAGLAADVELGEF